MNMAGVLVHTQPGRCEFVSDKLNELPGVEVHQQTDDGRLVVTVDDFDGNDAAENILKIHKLEGVISASLVFHHFEADEEEATSSSLLVSGGA